MVTQKSYYFLTKCFISLRWLFSLLSISTSSKHNILIYIPASKRSPPLPSCPYNMFNKRVYLPLLISLLVIITETKSISNAQNHKMHGKAANMNTQVLREKLSRRSSNSSAKTVLTTTVTQAKPSGAV